METASLIMEKQFWEKLCESGSFVLAEDSFSVLLELSVVILMGKYPYFTRSFTDVNSIALEAGECKLWRRIYIKRAVEQKVTYY